MFNPNVTPDSVLDAAIAHFKTMDNSFVVRICYWGRRPRRRAWFFVSSDAKSVVRISDEEAKPYNKGTRR